MTGPRDRSRDDRRQDERFVQDVLARTSGSPCGRALELVCDLVDQRLEQMDRRLVQAHLENCNGCRSVAVTLGWLGTELPALAEIDPGRELTSRVLAATTQLAAAEAHRRELVGAARLMDRLGRWWEGQIRRPVFALQAAYVATVLVALLIVVPGSPLKGLPGQALQMVQAGPDGSSPLGRGLGQASGWVGIRTEVMIKSVRQEAAGQWQKVDAALDQRAERSAEERTQLKTHLAGMIDMIEQRRIGEAGYEVLEAVKAGRSAWHDWWIADDDSLGTIERSTP